MKTVFIFLANGFEEAEALVTVDVLRRADFKVQTVSITRSKQVAGAHGVVVEADALIDDVDFSAADCLVLPGGMPGTSNLDQSEKIKTLLTHHYQKGGLLAAICAAPLVLGRLGMLKGKEAVCYPGFEKYLEGATIAKGKFAVSGNILTGKGPGCVFDFSLKLVELLSNKELAEQVADGLIWS